MTKQDIANMIKRGVGLSSLVKEHLAQGKEPDIYKERVFLYCNGCDHLYVGGREPDPCIGLMQYNGIYGVCCGHGTKDGFLSYDPESVDTSTLIKDYANRNPNPLSIGYRQTEDTVKCDDQGYAIGRMKFCFITFPRPIPEKAEVIDLNNL